MLAKIKALQNLGDICIPTWNKFPTKKFKDYIIETYKSNEKWHKLIDRPLPFPNDELWGGVQQYGVECGPTLFEGKKPELLAIDLDQPKDDEEDPIQLFNMLSNESSVKKFLSKILIVKTPSKGWHIYAVLPEELNEVIGRNKHTVNTNTDKKYSCDIKLNTNHIVGPRLT